MPPTPHPPPQFVVPCYNDPNKLTHSFSSTVSIKETRQGGIQSWKSEKYEDYSRGSETIFGNFIPDKYCIRREGMDVMENTYPNFSARTNFLQQWSKLTAKAM